MERVGYRDKYIVLFTFCDACMLSASSSKDLAQKIIIIYGVLIATSFCLYIFYLLRTVFLQLIIALVIAIALEPGVSFLIRHKIKRIWAIFLTLLTTFLLVAALVGLIAAPLITEGVKLVANAPEIIDQISANAQLQSFNEQYHVLSNVKNFFSTQGAKITSEGLIGGGIVGSVLGGVSAGIIIFIFSFFILLEGRIVWDKLLKFFNPAITIRISRVAEKMRRAVSGFVNGNLIISLIAGIVTLIPLLIFKVPYAFALAALVALFDLIPLVGAAIATIVVGLVALVKGWLVAVIIVGILLVYQFIEGHVIQPVVYSRTVRLSPFLIILATIIGAELLGIMGVLLGIPIAAVIQLAVLETLVGTETNQVKLAPKPTESRIDS